jgi:hypothetical protein
MAEFREFHGHPIRSPVRWAPKCIDPIVLILTPGFGWGVFNIGKGLEHQPSWGYDGQIQQWKPKKIIKLEMERWPIPSGYLT